MQQKRVSVIGVFLALTILLLGMCYIPVDNRYVGAVGENVSVTFDTNGGGQVNSTIVIVGEPYVLPTPNYSGHNFLGWYYNNGTQKVEIEGESWEINESRVTLKAKWELITYTIIYANIDGINGNNPNQTTYNVTDTIILEPVSRDGYIFDGWYEGVATKIEKIENRVGNLVLEASWTVIPYTITYDGVENVNNNPNPTTYNVEIEIELQDLTKYGYDFLGWYTNPDDLNTRVTKIEQGTTGNITLTALWDIQKCTIKYENNEFSEEVVLFGETIDELYIPTKDGYDFKGWYSDSIFRNKFTTDTVVTGDVTLYAKWVEKTNPIWFILCGGLAFVALIGAIVYMVVRKKNKAQGYEL